MDSFNKWRKMVFDVAKVDFDKICPGLSKISADCIKYDGYKGEYWLEGICSDKTEDFKNFDFNVAACLDYTAMPSSTIRTAHLTDSKDNLATVMVAFASTGIFYKKYTHFFQITVEGIKVAYAPEKTKFFMHDGFDHDKSTCGYATYKSLATDGYEISAARAFLKMKSYPRDQKAGWEVKDKIYITEPLRNYLGKTLPKLVDLYKSNEDLYEDAIDELLGID